jgi:hypothetical protein
VLCLQFAFKISVFILVISIFMDSEVLCKLISGQCVSGVLKVQGMYCMLMNLYYRVSHMSGTIGSIHLHFVSCE